MSTPNIQNYLDQEISFKTNNKDKRITLGSASYGIKGLSIEYDRNSAPKIFKIDSDGANWSDGITTYNTSLPRLAVLETVFSAVELPPNANTLQVNNTLYLTNGGNQSATVSISGMLLQNNSPNPNTYVIDIDNAYSLGVPTITLQDNYIGQSSILDTQTGLVLNNNNNITNTINSTSISAIDSNTNLQLALSNDINAYPEPFIRMQNQNGFNNYYRYSELNADGHYCFSFKNNEKFFKQYNPFSFNIYNANDGDYIDKSYPFILGDNINGLKLYTPTNYLDDNGNPGWSCLVSNLSGNDIQIDTAGYQWYAHSNGLVSGPIDIKKWATCRITLLFSNNTVGDYLWAVSQF